MGSLSIDYLSLSIDHFGIYLSLDWQYSIIYNSIYFSNIGANKTMDIMSGNDKIHVFVFLKSDTRFQTTKISLNSLLFA